jgi:hypothetical protein
MDIRSESTAKSGAKLQIAPEKSTPVPHEQQPDRGQDDIKSEEAGDTPGKTVRP